MERDFPLMKQNGHNSNLSVVRLLDAAARRLKPSALRILLHYTAQGDRFFQASEPQISADVGLSTSSVYDGIRDLVAGGFVTKRVGSTMRASSYELVFLDTVEIASSSDFEKPRSSKFEEPLFSEFESYDLDFRGTSSSEFEEPPPQNAGDTAMLGRVRSEECLTFEAVLDRIRRASPQTLSSDLIDHARRRLHGYMRKMGPEVHCHPPDNRTVAQFLSLGDGVGGWPALDALLNQLFAEGQKLKQVRYGWFLSVAMQRIHGVNPQVAKRGRELRVVAKAHGGRAVDAEVEQLDLQLHRLASGRRLQ